MIVSVTERGVFKRCHAQWDYTSRNRQNLQRIIPPTAFSLGSLVHKGLELWTINPEEKSAQDYLGVAAAQEIAAIQKRYFERVGVPLSDDEQGMLLDMFGLAYEMVGNYQKHWGSPLPEGFRLVQTEQTILMPIPGTEHACECLGTDKNCSECGGNGKTHHYLEGTLDAVIEDIESHLLFVLERKTYGNRPRLDVLEIADQFTAYAWLLQKTGIGQVGGVAYDGLWKRSVERQRGGPRKLEELFTRTLITRSPQQLASFERELTLEVLDMANPKIYRNFKWDGCWDCPVESLCLSEYKGEDSQWVREQEYMPRVTDIPWEDDTDAGE